MHRQVQVIDLSIPEACSTLKEFKKKKHICGFLEYVSELEKYHQIIQFHL